MKTRPELDLSNPITAAVLPLKSAAVERAAKVAGEFVERIAKELADAGNDANAYAPYPHANMSRADYMKKKARYELVRSLTVSTGPSSRRPRDPEPRVIDAARVATFIERAEEAAAVQYDAFVLKLCGKIGDVKAATLEGSHVWGYSELKVTKADESREVWRTQTIVNVSVLGKVFNQWPSRQVKA